MIPMLLRDPDMKGSAAAYAQVLVRAKAARGNDEEDSRAEFIPMARRARARASERGLAREHMAR